MLEPEILPAKPAAFKAEQVGNNIRLYWYFPKKMSDKKTEIEIDKIAKIVVRHTDKKLGPGKFWKKSKVIKKLKMNALIPYKEPRIARRWASYTSVQKKRYDKHLFYTDIPFDLKKLDSKTHYFGIRYFYANRRKSPRSKVAYVATKIPIAPISDLSIVKENKMIKLEWSKPELDLYGKPIANISGYKIFKAVKGNKTKKEGDQQIVVAVEHTFFEYNLEKILSEYFEDTDTGTDGVYRYYISAILSSQVQSAPSNIVNISITDEFPPDVPSNLVSFKASDHMFLTWKGVKDDDLSHYRVYRRTADENEFSMIADNVDVSNYKDKEIKRGILYIYCVTAVDTKGNESEYSNHVSEQF
ncbi:MAG: hypothetical protein GY757_43655 [bacterium]|nr:hypothetical protein [bacterium]